MKLASVEHVKEIRPHPNADSLEIDGKRFEGVVIKYGKTSFKVINLSYDERK